MKDNMKNIISIVSIFLVVTFYSCTTKEGQNNSKKVELTLSEPDAVDKSSVKYAPPQVQEEGEANGVDADLTFAESENSKEIDKSSTSLNNNIDKKKIIKDGSVSIKVTDIEKGKKSMDILVKNLNSYYENEKFENNENTISYQLKIRIPSGNFEKILSMVENSIGEITDKNIQARDVTEEFVDIQTRLNNKKNYLKKYNDILSKATTIKDIITVEESIRNLQEEIESKEGRLKYLNDQVSYSTLEISMYKEKEFIYKPKAQDKFSERIKKSLSNGWSSVVDFVLWTIAVWPFIILTIVFLYIIRRIIKKRKLRQSN